MSPPDNSLPISVDDAAPGPVPTEQAEAALNWTMSLREVLERGDVDEARQMLSSTLGVDVSTLLPPSPAVPAAVPSYSGPHFTAKLPDPKKFNGSPGEVDSFVATLNERFALSAFRSFTDADRVAYFSAFLVSPADQWHHSIRYSSPHLLEDYPAYVTAFRTHFEDPSLIRTIREKISRLTQKSSVTDYAAKFKALAAQAAMEPIHKRDSFWAGLKPEIQDALLLRGFAESQFDELSHQAILYDHLATSLKNSRRSTQGPSSGSISRSQFPSSKPPSASASGNSPSAPLTSSGPWPMDIDAVKSRLVNGKLPPEELKRRVDNNLCTYCAAPGHAKDNCPKRSGKVTPPA
jgi:hypothetical protein